MSVATRTVTEIQMEIDRTRAEAEREWKLFEETPSTNVPEKSGHLFAYVGHTKRRLDLEDEKDKAYDEMGLS